VPVAVRLHQVIEIESRLSQKLVSALLLQGKQPALDGADAGSGNVAVLRLELFGIVAHVLQHGLQVFEVKQQQAVVIRDLERQSEHAGLCIVEVEQAAEEQGAHLGGGGADGVALLAKHIPASRRISAKGEILELEFLNSLGDFGIVPAWLADAREIALHIRCEHRHAKAAEVFGHHLQGDRLARPRGTRHQAVTVRHIG